MNAKDSLRDRIRRGEEIHGIPGLLLSAITPLYRTGMRIRLLGERVRCDARVISFGNITTGGTGKTPAVIERAQQEVAAGRRVAVLTRGYKGRKQRKREVALLDAEDAALQPDVIGDEPALIARRVPGLVIARSADRVMAACDAIRDRGCDTLILDDGFQYVRLERDENIVLIDATNPFGNGHLLPRGTLREPMRSLQRATAIILTHCDQAHDANALRATLNRYCPQASVRTTRHAPTGLWNVNTGEKHPIDAIRGRTIAAACAIGRPEGFFATLEGLGARLAEKHSFGDHESFDPCALGAGKWLVVTEKDAMRFRHPPLHTYALSMELQDWPLL